MSQEQTVTSPHDRIFKKTFSRKNEAIGFIKSNVPKEILKLMDLDSLDLEPGSFVDEELGEFHSDLVYKIKLKGKEAFIYFLFEHQSSVDPLMGLKLLAYLINLWKYLLQRMDRKQGKPIKLPIIIPLVLYQGKDEWRVSKEFKGLFQMDEETQSIIRPFIPNFEYLLVDLSTLDYEMIQGELLGRITLNLMKAAMCGNLIETLEKIAPLMVELLQRKDSLGMIETLLKYMMEVEKDINLKKLEEIITNVNTDIGGKVMTIAEKLRKEGREEGREEGWKDCERIKQYETANNLLRLRKLSGEEIAQVTGLPINEIIELQEKSQVAA